MSNDPKIKSTHGHRGSGLYVSSSWHIFNYVSVKAIQQWKLSFLFILVKTVLLNIYTLFKFLKKCSRPRSGSLFFQCESKSGSFFLSANPESGSLFFSANPGSGSLFFQCESRIGSLFSSANPGSGSLFFQCESRIRIPFFQCESRIRFCISKFFFRCAVPWRPLLQNPSINQSQPCYLSIYLSFLL